MNLEEDYPYFFEVMKRNCLWFYIKKIRKPINMQKAIDMKNFEKRADYGQVVVLQGDMSTEINNIVDKEYDRNLDTKGQDEVHDNVI